jgi:hypothetical protein
LFYPVASAEGAWAANKKPRRVVASGFGLTGLWRLDHNRPDAALASVEKNQK